MTQPVARPPRTHALHTRWFIDLMAHAAASGVSRVTLPRFRYDAIMADLDPALVSTWFHDGELCVFGVPVTVSDAS